MRKDIYGDGISYVSNEVSSIPVNQSNLNEENRIKFVTDLAAVSRGKSESKNPERRYHALLKEAAPTCAEITMLSDDEKPKGSPSRPLEFLPVVVDILPDYYNNQATFSLWAVDATEEDNSIEEFNDLSDAMGLLKYSHVSRHPTDKHLMRVYTNMRALINAGIPYEKIPYNKPEDLESFVAIKANIPMFVWAQVPNTHTQISKEAQSDRVAENNGYWLPNDFRERVHAKLEDTRGLSHQTINHLKTILTFNNKDAIIECLLSEFSQNEVQHLFKDLGYPREIWSRAMYYFKYKEVVMTGWMNDPNVWKHLFYERNGHKDVWKNWTQSETEQFVKCIQELIE